MKRIILLIIILSLSTLCTQAHPGAVDKNGGHTDSKTGKYHYHSQPKPDPKPEKGKSKAKAKDEKDKPKPKK